MQQGEGRQYIDRMPLPSPLIALSTRLVPGRCQVCARWPAQPVCDECLARFASPRRRCTACAAPLEAAHALCGACLTLPHASPLSRCVAVVDYGYPWDGLIARWKFGGETGWSGLWARLLWRDTQTHDLWRSASHVVPVPVSPDRLAQRGFNQAWELVKALQCQAGREGPRPLPQALVRLRETADQHSLPRAKRMRNLQGALAPHPGHAATWRGGHVLLVDDVSTTGATLQAAAQCLIDGGAARVSALVLARTPPPA